MNRGGGTHPKKGLQTGPNVSFSFPISFDKLCRGSSLEKRGPSKPFLSLPHHSKALPLDNIYRKCR